MSDFFYKERLGPVFSPVINIKRENVSPTVVSAIDNLLSPTGNMFTRAETVRNLMMVEKLSLEQTAKALSIKITDVANKLRLLEFSQNERGVILEYGFTEAGALLFLELDKPSRLYAMEYCHKNSYSTQQIQGYVEGVVNSGRTKKIQREEKIERVKKCVVNDVGFFFNSIENALRLARRAGLEVENHRSEKEDSYDIHIKIKKRSD